MVIAYNCGGSLMCGAAAEVGIRPIQLWYMDCMRRIRGALRADYDEALDSDLALCRLPPRRGRRCDRAVKIKMSNYPRKRHGQKSGPTPYQRQRRDRQSRALAR